MLKQIKRVLIGRPLSSSKLHDEKLGVLWGLPILSSDAISSVAYASQEMLLVLVPAVGFLAFQQLSILSGAIIALLIILTISYRQTIDNYPNGGGAFIVAKENIGLTAGVAAGAALSVDYVLTVAVSVSSGVEQIASAYAPLKEHSVIVSVVLVLLLTLGNLRGIRESSKIFGIPPYAFIFGLISMIIVGFYKLYNGYAPPVPIIKSAGESVTLVLMLKAFSSGCTALTGIEAVSNAVPNFKSPAPKYAKNVLILLSFIILILFGGTAILANNYIANPHDGALLVQMSKMIFGTGFMYYYIAITTFIILIMAANTAYSGFPMLISVMSWEGFAPRQLNMRGDRLSYDNGIWLLSLVSIILIIAFKAKVNALIGLYAIGVFISFTLSQSGMYLKWIRSKNKNWVLKATINGFGALVTATVVIIIGYTKFHEGAWIVIVLIPILIYFMLKIKKHYTAVSKQLIMNDSDFDNLDITVGIYRNRIIVPIQSINKSSIRALRYAKSISDNVTAFSVSIDDSKAKKIENDFKKLNLNIRLIVKYSPFREIVKPLLKYIESVEYDYKKGDMITVILPQFTVYKWWHRILHNNTRFFIEKELLKHKHIVVSVMPLQLKADDVVLKNPKYN